jgi:hypothetical protein
MAVLNRREHQDFVTTFDCRSWDVVQSVQTPESAYLEDIVFAPMKDDRKRSVRSPIYAWESPAFSNRIFIFSPDGQSCRVISGNEENESLLTSGYERIVWSRAGWIAAVIKDYNSFAVWNSILQKVCASIELGPNSIQQGQTVHNSSEKG